MNPALPWIFHSYNGSPEFTEQLLSKRFLFSFGENLLREKSKAVKSFKILPLDKIFLETDDYDGTVDKIYEQAAKIKKVSIEKLRLAIWENFDRIEKSISNRG